MTNKGLDVASGDQVARPQTEAGVAASLLEEIRFRIWHNTGCSDDAAEGAAAAVYDLFLDQKAVAADLLALAHNLERWLLKDAEPSHVGSEDMRVYHLDGGVLGNLLNEARAAIAKAEGRS